MRGHEVRGRTAREVAEAWIAAVAACDVDAALELSSPSIVYCVGSVTRYEGHDGVRDLIEDYARLSGFASPRVRAGVEQDGVVALHRVVSFMFPEGALDMPCVSFVEVEDGLVVRYADYQNMRPFDELTGL